MILRPSYFGTRIAPDHDGMDAISISVASGMRARMQSLDLLANNLANAETSGFKADREFYSVYASAEARSDVTLPGTSTLPVIEKQWTDMSPGELRVTSNPFDLAISGEGLFAVQTPGGERFTRNGAFRLAADGVLSTSDGHPVQSANGGKITLDPNSPLQVLTDGSLLQNGASAGRLRLIRVDPASLARDGAGYFSAAPGAAAPATNASVTQGAVERSNVATAGSAVQLVSITREFEMLQKAAGIGNDFAKKSISEVARPVQ